MISFRTAVAADAEALVPFVNGGYYRGPALKKGWTTEADIFGGQRTDPDKMREMIDAAGARVELAHAEDGTLIGCVYLKKELRTAPAISAC